MQRGWERVVARNQLVALADQGRLTQREAGEEMGLSERHVRRLVKRYRESEGQLGSLAFQRRHRAPDGAAGGQMGTPERHLGGVTARGLPSRVPERHRRAASSGT